MLRKWFLTTMDNFTSLVISDALEVSIVFAINQAFVKDKLPELD